MSEREVRLDRNLLDNLARLVAESSESDEHPICAECGEPTAPGDLCEHLPETTCRLDALETCTECCDIAAQDAADERAVEDWVEARHE